MRGSLSMLTALSACISAVAALPQPKILRHADGHKKPRYSVVPLEPVRDADTSSEPVTVVKTLVKTPSTITRVVVKTESPVTRVVVKTKSPVTHVVFKTAGPKTVTKPTSLPATKPLSRHGASTVSSESPVAPASLALAPEPAVSSCADLAVAPSAVGHPPHAAPSFPACEAATPPATPLASRHGPLAQVTPTTPALVRAPSTLSTVRKSPQPLPTWPPSASSPTDSEAQAPHLAWNGTAAFRHHWP